jgi:hypothetical protein
MVYVGNLKDVRRIYQQTFVDTYSKVAHCKLYVTKTPITAADLLNDKVLPFYNAHHLPMRRILTDRGMALALLQSMIINFIWRLMILTILRQKLCRHKRMGSANVFIKLFYMSFIW